MISPILMCGGSQGVVQRRDLQALHLQELAPLGAIFGGEILQDHASHVGKCRVRRILEIGLNVAVDRQLRGTHAQVGGRLEVGIQRRDVDAAHLRLELALQLQDRQVPCERHGPALLRAQVQGALRGGLRPVVHVVHHHVDLIEMDLHGTLRHAIFGENLVVENAGFVDGDLRSGTGRSGSRGRRCRRRAAGASGRIGSDRLPGQQRRDHPPEIVGAVRILAEDQGASPGAEERDVGGAGEHVDVPSAQLEFGDVHRQLVQPALRDLQVLDLDAGALEAGDAAGRRPLQLVGGGEIGRAPLHVEGDAVAVVGVVLAELEVADGELPFGADGVEIEIPLPREGLADSVFPAKA